MGDAARTHEEGQGAYCPADCYDYLAEKRASVAIWESMLTAMIEGKRPNVVKLSKTA